MLGRTHLAIGVLLLFVLAKFTDLVQGNAIFGAALILLSSILPDIDHTRSIIGRKVKWLSKFLKHRGFFHSIFAAVLFTILIQIIFQSRNLSLLFIIGYVNHLFFDSITKEGTTLFYPAKNKIKGPLRVGSWLETVIFLLLLVLAVYLVV